MPAQTETAAGGKPACDNDRYWAQRLEREFSLAGVGHAGVGEAFNHWAYRVRRKVLLRTLRAHGIQSEGAKLLELAFGTGYYLDLWRQQRVKFVRGFDITAIAVKNACERFKDTGWSFSKASIGQPLPLDEHAGTFDLATAFDVLFHLVEDQAWNGALDNITVALKPGGHAVIFDKYQQVENAIDHVRYRTLDMYREALTKRGFEIVTIQPIFFFMNSPMDLSGFSRLVWKTSWSLTRIPYKLGKHIGLGEILGDVMGAGLYLPELAMNSVFKSGPSTKLLLARKK